MDEELPLVHLRLCFPGAAGGNGVSLHGIGLAPSMALVLGVQTRPPVKPVASHLAVLQNGGTHALHPGRSYKLLAGFFGGATGWVAEPEREEEREGTGQWNGFGFGRSPQERSL